jgi:hypothetical protein
MEIPFTEGGGLRPTNPQDDFSVSPCQELSEDKPEKANRKVSFLFGPVRAEAKEAGFMPTLPPILKVNTLLGILRILDDDDILPGNFRPIHQLSAQLERTHFFILPTL